MGIVLQKLTDGYRCSYWKATTCILCSVPAAPSMDLFPNVPNLQCNSIGRRNIIWSHHILLLLGMTLFHHWERSEGTLGVITEITLRLQKLPSHFVMLTSGRTVHDLNYPEKLETYCVVNVPHIFFACWKLVWACC